MIEATIKQKCVACGKIYKNYPSGGLCHHCGNMSFKEVGFSEPTADTEIKPEPKSSAAEVTETQSERGGKPRFKGNRR